MTEKLKPCQGMNCGCTDGRSHSLECLAEHSAAIAGGYFVKAEQPAAVSVPRELAGRLCSRDNHVRQTARRELRNMMLSEIECESKYTGLLVLPDRMSGHKSDVCESSYQEGYNTALDRVELCNSGKTVKADLLRRLEWAIADMDHYNPELLELRAILEGGKP